MPEVKAGEDVPRGADAVWQVIGDFSGIRKWAVLVQAETTEETPEGKFRTLTMQDGRSVRERLAHEDAHSYTYTLDRPDMKEYFSTVSVVPVSADASRIELVVRFVPTDDAVLAAATERMEKFCRGNIRAMKKALGLA